VYTCGTARLNSNTCLGSRRHRLNADWKCYCSKLELRRRVNGRRISKTSNSSRTRENRLIDHRGQIKRCADCETRSTWRAGESEKQWNKQSNTCERKQYLASYCRDELIMTLPASEVRSTVIHKKLSCRREAARRSMSLKILLSHSRSLKVIWNYTD